MSNMKTVQGVGPLVAREASPNTPLPSDQRIKALFDNVFELYAANDSQTKKELKKALKTETAAPIPDELLRVYQQGQFILGELYRSENKNEKAKVAYETAQKLGYYDTAAIELALNSLSVPSLSPKSSTPQSESLKVSLSETFSPKPSLNNAEQEVNWAQRILDLAKKGGDQNLTLEAIQGLNRSSPWANQYNPLPIMRPLIQSLIQDNLIWESSALKTEIAALAHQYCYFTYSRSREHPLPPTVKEEIKQEITQALRLVKEKERPETTLRFHLECLLATIELVKDDSSAMDEITLHGAYLLQLTHGIASLATGTGADETLLNAAAHFAKIAFNAVKNEIKDRWYQKLLYVDHLTKKALDNPEKTKESVDELQRLLEANADGAWQVLYGGIQALHRIIENTSSIDVQIQAYRVISSYLTFERFRFTNNWRIRFIALEVTLLLKDHPHPELKSMITGNLVIMDGFEQDKRVRRLYDSPEILTSIKALLKQGVSHKQTDIEKILENQKTALDELQKLIQQTPKGSEYDKLLKDFQTKCDNVSAQMENFRNLEEKIEERISIVDTLPETLSKHQQLLEQLIGTPLTVPIERMRERILSDENRQKEQLLYIPPSSVSSRLQLGQPAFFQPLQERYQEFMESEYKVMLLQAFAGSGKTIFSQKIEEDQLNAYLSNPKEEWLPLRIELAAVQDPVHQAIQQGLAFKGFTPWHINQLQEQKVLLIIDGVDEARFEGVPLSQSLYFTNQLHLWKKAKVIFGLRISEGAQNINPLQFAPYANESLESRQAQLLQEVFITPFSSNQVGDYIRKYIDQAPQNWRDAYPQWIANRGELYLDTFRQISKHMSETPFILRVMAEVLPGIIEEALRLADGNEDAIQIIKDSMLYEEFVRRWFRREFDKLVNIPIPPEIQESGIETYANGYCMELAHAMFKKGITTVIYDTSRFRQKETTHSWKPFFDVNDPVVRICTKVSPIKKVGANGFAFLHARLLDFFESKFCAAEIEENVSGEL